MGRFEPAPGASSRKHRRIFSASGTSARKHRRIFSAPGPSTRIYGRIFSAPGTGARQLGNDRRFFFLWTRVFFRKLTLLIRIQFPLRICVRIQLTLEFELLVTLEQFRKFPLLKLQQLELFVSFFRIFPFF